ncbi:hypothetical protein E3N88_05659 [Mikania micrantha]|uniref:Serine-threonine/tyrosine-protein kinase catalytic domain-containing protein n=1 Tax=Mikania micrantha TaxID=192012 RepID=A0A5N6PLK1_9ASTR|nr:hypothetical protein E3N88_05659 [Mikania micrantha]
MSFRIGHAFKSSSSHSPLQFDRLPFSDRFSLNRARFQPRPDRLHQSSLALDQIVFTDASILESNLHRSFVLNEPLIFAWSTYSIATSPPVSTLDRRLHQDPLLIAFSRSQVPERTVYRGIVTCNDGDILLDVAIKRLDSDSSQGAGEFWAEVEMLSKLRHCHLAEVNYLGQFSHQNLVNLIGYCLEDEHRLLVYEFMPRGSLENHLFRSRLTRKSDVYAFGVVLFEVLCGKQAVDRSVDEEHWGLATWAQDSIKEGRLKQIVDPELREIISPKCLKEFALLADRCLHSRPKQRPTMAEVVVGLESILALHERPDNTLFMKFFRTKVPTSMSPPNPESSVGGTSLKFVDIYLYTVGGEHRIVRRFDFNTILDATQNFSNAYLPMPGDMPMYKSAWDVHGWELTWSNY